MGVLGTHKYTSNPIVTVSMFNESVVILEELYIKEPHDPVMTTFCSGALICLKMKRERRKMRRKKRASGVTWAQWMS